MERDTRGKSKKERKEVNSQVCPLTGGKNALSYMIEVKMEIGEAVKGWRHWRGLSQWDLAHKSGVGYATIARLELEMVDPRLSTLERLAEALRIDVVNLLTGPPQAKRPTRRRAGRR